MAPDRPVLLSLRRSSLRGVPQRDLGDAPPTDRSVACWHRNAYRQEGRNGCREARPLRGRRHPQRVAITPPTFPLAVAPPERRARRARWVWGGEISGQGAITAREKPRGRPRRTPCTQSCWNSSPLSGLRTCSQTQTTRGGQVRRAARGGHDHPGTQRGPACRALSQNPGETQQTPRPLPSRPPTGTALPRTRPSDSQMSSPSTDQQHRGRAPCRAYLHRGRCGTDGIRRGATRFSCTQVAASPIARPPASTEPASPAPTAPYLRAGSAAKDSTAAGTSG